MESQVRYLAFFSFFTNRPLRVLLDWKSLQEYPVNAVVPQGSILDPIYFLLYMNGLSDDVICNIAIYADDTTIYSKCDQMFDPWQRLEFSSELKFDLRDTVDLGKKWLFDSSAEKTQLVSFDWSNNIDAIDVKRDGSFLEKNSSFKKLKLT